MTKLRVLDEISTSANLENVHEFIIKEYSPHLLIEAFLGKPKAKP